MIMDNGGDNRLYSNNSHNKIRYLDFDNKQKIVLLPNQFTLININDYKM